MFSKKKISKTAKNTIIKNYGRLKGWARRKPPPKYATVRNRRRRRATDGRNTVARSAKNVDYSQFFIWRQLKSQHQRSQFVVCSLRLQKQPGLGSQARRTNNRKVMGSMPAKVVCVSQLTGNRLG